MALPTIKTKKRYNILALIFGTVVINYLDRTNISVAASAISESLELSTVQMGLIFHHLVLLMRHYKYLVELL
ncbi:hypothetical protein [Algibacter lectus]|uniref:D-galactonate transporter n=1 Tax=Algibacter lectus TaxID=221126 RepID=A0A090VHP4_9FLAO|nr:hypothetical protein [Algibacter lectus]GAL63563.1 D-galactonate transporter [Algibacter lectus]